jgi:crotonobetainyl-CoA:carnitine CoA-transferase CaiB-like acyl-CoA transferase
MGSDSYTTPSERTSAEAGIKGALAGYRILDLTTVIMGPYATQILGDLGADIISIEGVGGDPNRDMGLGRHPQLSGTALNLLRNKRNVCLDLKKPEGHQALLNLAATCDVFVTNMRPSAIKRLGISYEDIKSVRPDVIYCEAHGYALDSARSEDPAYDDVIQASSGLADLMRKALGEPRLFPTIVADKIAGLAMAYSILAAVIYRQRTGKGQQIEVPMQDVAAAFVTVEHGDAAVQIPALGPVGYPRALSKDRRPHATKDGYLLLLPYSRRNWVSLFLAGGIADAESDVRLESAASRAQSYDSLYADLGALAQSKTTDEWLEICAKHSIPCSRVSSLEEIIDGYPEAEHPVSGRFHYVPHPVRYSEMSTELRSHAPLIGQHNSEVFSEIGYSQGEIERLVAAGALRDKPLAET